MNIFFSRLFLLCFFLSVLFSCKNPKVSQNFILVSIPPLVEVTKAIAGEDFQVVSLAQPQSSAHDFSPTPKDMVKLSQAFVYFEIGIKGLEAEEQMKVLIEKNRPHLPLLKVSDNIAFLSFNSSLQKKGEVFDPHIWLSVLNMKQIALNIKNHLVKLFPQKKDIFITNFSFYKQKLALLHQEITELLKDEKGKGFIQFHPAWAYFAKDYHLALVGSVQPHGGHDEGVSLFEIQKLFNKALKSNALALAVEPQFNQTLVKQVAKELKIPLAYLDNLEGIKENQSYFILMKNNALALKKAFHSHLKTQREP